MSDLISQIKEQIFTKKINISFGKDSLIYNSFQYYLLFVLQIYYLYTLYNNYSPYYLFLFIFIGIPIIDEICEVDKRNLTKQEELRMQYELRFKIPLFLTIIMDWFVTYTTIVVLLTHETTLFRKVLILFLSGTTGATTINISHELCHKLDNPFDWYFGFFGLAKTMYMHFPTEHNFGHHKNVSTPNDPATSKKGQTLYAFLVQTVVGTVKSCYKIECERTLKKHKNIKNPNCIYNKFFWYMAINITMPILAYIKFGFLGMIYFIITAFGQVMILEMVNYIEHYGLLRKKLEDGTYEKVNHHHSWNAPHRISNYLFFKLQRHSDHHENSTKPYQILVSHEDSPTLPNGYSMMVLLAPFPKVFFSIMDDILLYYKNDRKDPALLLSAQRKSRVFLAQLSAVLVAGLFVQNYFEL